MGRAREPAADVVDGAPTSMRARPTGRRGRGPRCAPGRCASVRAISRTTPRGDRASTTARSGRISSPRTRSRSPPAIQRAQSTRCGPRSSSASSCTWTEPQPWRRYVISSSNSNSSASCRSTSAATRAAPGSKRRLNAIHGGRSSRGDRGRAGAVGRGRLLEQRRHSALPDAIVASATWLPAGVAMTSASGVPASRSSVRSRCAVTAPVPGPSATRCATRARRPGSGSATATTRAPGTRSSAGRYPTSARRPQPTIPMVTRSVIPRSARARRLPPVGSRGRSARTAAHRAHDSHRHGGRGDQVMEGVETDPDDRSGDALAPHEERVEGVVERDERPRGIRRPAASEPSTTPTVVPMLAAALNR